MSSVAQAVSSVLWQPQPGPQTAFLTCPISEIFYGGARGGGKTDAFLGHWLRHWATYGPLARGIFFRQSYKMLDQVVKRGKELFTPLGAKFLGSGDKYMFVFPDGAELRLRHLKSVDDANEYQGHEYNWIAFEEVTQWASPAPIDRLRAVCRSSQGVKCWFLMNGNPGGVGHQWVKDRYITPSAVTNGGRIAPHKVVFMVGDVAMEVDAVFIPATVWDNQKLLDSQPTYIHNLFASGPKWLVEAWLEGNWDIIAGGFLEGIWREDKHVVPPYEIPRTWPRFRCMDWGSARPYAIGYFAQNPDTKKLVLYRELYGWGGAPNIGTRETAVQCKARMLAFEAKERAMGVEFRKNPADPAIWAKLGHEQSIEEYFRKAECEIGGRKLKEPVRWIKADTSPGSRERNAQMVIALLKHDLFECFEGCTHFRRTVPTIPADEDNPEDVDTDAEDHMFDMFKMAAASRRRSLKIEFPVSNDPQPFTGAWVEGLKDGTYSIPRPAR